MKSLRILSPDNVKIGERAFENCVSLKSVELPETLTELYGGVFNSCKSIQRIHLPQKLTILGESAFSDCVGLEEIAIPEAVTKIDDLAPQQQVKPEQGPGGVSAGRAPFLHMP